MINLINLLNRLEKDYNHPWPNEDLGTRKHRLILLEDIRAEIKRHQQNPTKPNKNVKVPKFDVLTEGYDPSKLKGLKDEYEEYFKKS